MTEREALTEGLLALGMPDCPQAVDKLLRFSEMLLERNRVMNLTAVKEPMEVVTRHFLDCAAALAPLHPEGRIADVGCGAGFPGMPCALLYPGAQVTLLDSLGKRIHFLSECISALGMENAQAVHARAEEFAAAHRESYDLVTSRAVARMNILCELCLPLVRVGGRFAAMKSVSSDDELYEAGHAVRILGGVVEQVLEYEVPLIRQHSRIIIIRKEKVTPGKYPRRFGKISANPLQKHGLER